MPRKLRSNEINYSRTTLYHVTSKCVRSLHLLASPSGGADTSGIMGV